MADGGYGSWTALAQAIKSAATRARAEGTTNQDVTAQIVQARQDRFLARVFAPGEQSEWLLKGGGAMLARVPHTRATRDVDLAVSSGDLDEAQAALERAAGRDLDDHLRFELTGARDTGRGDNQPGCRPDDCGSLVWTPRPAGRWGRSLSTSSWGRHRSAPSRQ